MALDVAIGMVFVFVLFSTIVSGIQEFFAWVLELRAKTFRARLSELLTDPSSEELVKQFLSHPSVKQHTGSVWFPSEAPSYLRPATFSHVLVDLFTGSGARDAVPSLRHALATVPPGCGQTGLALEAILLLDAPSEGLETERANAFMRATTWSNDAERTRMTDEMKATRDAIAGAPESFVKALCLDALEARPAQFSKGDSDAKLLDRRKHAALRLARLIARRSPVNALQHGLLELHASPARDAMLAVLDASSEESRQAAVERMTRVITGARDGLKSLEGLEAHLPDGPIKQAFQQIMRPTEAATREAGAVDLGRLMIHDPVGELRHVAALLGPKSELGRKLRTALDASVKTSAHLSERLSHLFDDAMEHGSTVYRRQSQLTIAAISVAVAFAGNVDTFALVRGLSTSAPLRQAVVESTVSWVKDHPQTQSGPESTRTARAITSEILNDDQEIHALGLPLGWTGESWRSAWHEEDHWYWKLLGLIVSAFGMSLGAPFWYRLADRLTNIRSTVSGTSEKRDGAAETK